MLEISVTNPRNTGTHMQSCTYPFNSWAVWVTETPSFPKIADFPVYMSPGGSVDPL